MKSTKNLQSRHPLWLKALACMLTVFLAACSVNANQAAAEPVRIGITSQMSSRLIGMMVEELGQRNGIECRIVEVPDGISNLQPPLESGTLQIGVELAQSAWKSVLNERQAYEPQNLLQLERYYQSRGLRWNPLPMTRDVYTLAISKKLAAEREIETLSDLAKISQDLTIGAPMQYFEDADGYPWMNQSYGISFRTTKNLPTEYLAQALRNGDVDVIPIHTLDGLLRKNELFVLEDDLSTCTSSELGLVIRDATLMEYPQFAGLFDDLARTVNAQQLAYYGRLVIYGGLSEQEAALQYLKAKDLIRESPDEAGKRLDEIRTPKQIHKGQMKQ